MYAVPRGTLKIVADSAKDDKTRTALACSCILSPGVVAGAIVSGSLRLLQSRDLTLDLCQSKDASSNTQQPSHERASEKEGGS